METKSEIGYEEVYKLACRLSNRDKKRLIREIDLELGKGTDNPLNDLQALLLTGPVMSDEQFRDYQRLRDDFNKWGTS